MSILNAVIQLSVEVSKLLTLATIEMDYSEVRKIRDQVFTLLLKINVDEICDYDQLVFYDNEERRIGYTNAYLCRIRKKSSKFITEDE